MDVNIHEPTRTRCNTMYVVGNSQHTAVVGFSDARGSELVMYFSDPEALRNHATALKLLAESLEEKQCTPTA